MINKTIVGIVGIASALFMSGCTRDWKAQDVSMWNESRYKPYEQSSFFADNSTSRPISRGTVARGQLRTDEAFFNGTLNGTLVTQLPFPVTQEVITRGKVRYEIYCAPCHGEGGAGNGMIIQRGFSKPPDYVEQRLVDAPVGHLYDVITNGYGSMYSYASRVSPRDRWAITAYIRVLQRHRGAKVSDVPADKRAQLNQRKPSDDALPEGAPMGGGAISSGASNERTSQSLDGPRLGSPAGQSSNGGVSADANALATPGAPETTTLPSVRADSLSPQTNPAAGAGDNANGQISGRDESNSSAKE